MAREHYRWQVSTGLAGGPRLALPSAAVGTKPGFRANTTCRRCRIRSSLTRVSRSMARYYLSRLGAAPPMAACGCIRRMPRRCSRWCGATAWPHRHRRDKGGLARCRQVGAKAVPKLVATPEPKPESKRRYRRPTCRVPAALRRAERLEHAPRSAVTGGAEAETGQNVLERHLGTAPGTTGAVLVELAEPPALAAAGSEPVNIFRRSSNSARLRSPVLQESCKDLANARLRFRGVACLR